MLNNSTNRWLTLLTVLLLIANAVTLYFFWQKDNQNTRMAPPPRGMGSGPVFEFIVKSLDFSSEQEKKFSQLRDAHRTIQQPLVLALKNAKDSFYALLPNSGIADSSLLMASERSANISQQLDLINFKHFQDIRKICTASQAEKFDGIIRDLIAKMGKGQGALPVEHKPNGDDHRRPPPMEDGGPPPPPEMDH